MNIKEFEKMLDNRMPGKELLIAHYSVVADSERGMQMHIEAYVVNKPKFIDPSKYYEVADAD